MCEHYALDAHTRRKKPLVLLYIAEAEIYVHSDIYSVSQTTSESIIFHRQKWLRYSVTLLYTVLHIIHSAFLFLWEEIDQHLYSTKLYSNRNKVFSIPEEPTDTISFSFFLSFIFASHCWVLFFSCIHHRLIIFNKNQQKQTN